MNMIEAIERVTVTIKLGSKVGAGLLLSSLQRVELHRHRVWRYNTLYPSGHVLQCYSVTCYTHHNEPVLRPLSHVVAALGPSQLALCLGPAGLAVVCHLVTISGAASPPPGHMSQVTCHMSRVTCHVSQVTCHVSHVTMRNC